MFSAEDEDIVSVNSKGILKGKKIGSTEVLIAAKGYSKKVNVNVVAKITEIKNVGKVIRVEEGETVAIKPRLKPDEFADEPVRYHIKNHETASISANGKLRGKRKGTTKLIVTAGGCQKTVKVVVYEYTPSQQEPTDASYLSLIHI